MTPSTPIHNTLHPALSAAGIAVHGLMLFLAPLLVGGVAGMFLEVSQVAETGSTLITLTFLCIFPFFLIQIAGVAIKTHKSTQFLRAQNALNLRTFLHTTYLNTRILTSRGAFVLFSGIVFVLLSLGFQWASLGVVAVATLGIFYIVTGVAVFLSAFFVRTFQWGMGRNRAGIRREYHPAVARCGDAIEERFILERVPVLPGFYLLIDETLPKRLNTETRHVIPPTLSNDTNTLTTHLKDTPRGTHHTGPAHIRYTDMLGLTEVNVASITTGKVKILPKITSVEIQDPPKTPLQEPDILTRPNKFPTEDFFRFREYNPGDDTRRLHWKLSMRVGQLQVRLPESREVNARKVLLALDTFVPPSWLSHTPVIDTLLDALVDVWVSTADQLINQGEHVTLVTTLRDEHGHLKRTVLPCERTDRTQWLDAGAQAAWQSEVDVFDLFEEDNTDEQFMVILTSRLSPIPPNPIPSKRTTWIYLHPQDTIGPEPPDLMTLWYDFRDEGPELLTTKTKIKRFLQLPHPVGSDENALLKRISHFWERRIWRTQLLYVRSQILQYGEQAFSSLLQRDDVVYRMQVLHGGGRYRLVGISSGVGGPTRDVPPSPSTPSPTHTHNPNPHPSPAFQSIHPPSRGR